MFNININAKDFEYDAVAIACFMYELQKLMPQKQKENTSSVVEPSDAGPLATHWTAITSRRIRRTEGRSAEEQAEHNLRSYKGYSEDDLDAVRNGTFVGKVVDSDEESITVEEDTEEETLTEQDLF